MLVAIYNRTFKIEDVEVFKILFHELQVQQAQIILYDKLVDKLTNVIPLPKNYTVFSDTINIPNHTNFMISMGGDGTILDTVQYVNNKNIPILGINLGRLGFLAGITVNEIPFAINSIANSIFIKDERSLLHLDCNKPIFKNAPYALNDFSIQRKDSNALVKIHTYLNGEFLCTYWADGLIVSTPTGSTGYSLSCGGPIVSPMASNFIITPVAAHNLNIRPLVISDNTIVSFEVEGRSKEFLCTLDSRTESIDDTFSLAVRKANFTVTLVRLEGQNFLNTIRNKMYWGMDKRN